MSALVVDQNSNMPFLRNEFKNSIFSEKITQTTTWKPVRIPETWRYAEPWNPPLF